MKLKLFTKPDVPLEAECISTAVISQLKVKEAEKMKIYHGNREANIADFFKVTKGKDDLLEVEGVDIRNQNLKLRRSKLAKLINLIPDKLPIKLSAEIKSKTWSDLRHSREKSRSQKAEGVMLKNKGSAYYSGRKKGDWWKWKLDPFTIDGVLIYAQAGHGRRANLYTDYTFAIWDDDQLVPFTKAYSGLKDEEFRQITSWVKKNTIQKFGPVRQVPPELVFEIAFEGIHESTRHKSGVALRFPRMLRWRHDKLPKEANKLEDLKAFLT